MASTLWPAIAAIHPISTYFRRPESIRPRARIPVPKKNASTRAYSASPVQPVSAAVWM